MTSLAAANRLLAITAIADAKAKQPEPIERANDKLDDGDEAVTDSRFKRAIADYADAWSLAENAR